MAVRLGEVSSLDLDDEELVRRAREGDERALDALLGRYRHYARAKARAYFLAGADKDDLVQEGMIGLFKAVRDFRSDQNVAFRAFAELCIKRQIITAIKSSRRQKHLPLNSYVSLNSPVSSEAEDESARFDAAAPAAATDPAELVISAEEIASIKGALRTLLSTLETDVLRLYMDGRSYQEIAETLGRHVKSIDNALQRIKRKLEEHVRERAHHSK
ncbi:MAG TPA: RNA polymerase sporulation sigma factor SigH [Actinomycetota bacterium]|jgi:RNA polymerase sporulation-specific sigma factor|nr:RNA polymerase sporulation sigma factor SigH [Actinomycetota bacterium]